MGLPSTQKGEEIVAVEKPPAPKIRSPDTGGPCDIKFVKPVIFLSTYIPFQFRN